MRAVFSMIRLQDGELTVLKPFVSSVDVGSVRIPRVGKNASVHGLLIDLLKVNPKLHLYLGSYFAGDAAPPGVYKDADVERLSWVLFPGRYVRVPGLAEVFGIDSGFQHFSDVSRNPLPLDVVTGSGPMYVRRVALQVSSALRRVPGITRHESAYGPSGNAVEAWGKPGKDIQMQEAVLAACMNIGHVFLSEDNKKNFENLFFRSNFSPAMQRRLADRTFVFQNGIDCELLDAWMAEDGGFQTKRDRSVGSFYRLAPLKGTEAVLALCQKMAVAGQVDRAVVTWAPGSPLEDGLPDGNKTVPPNFQFFPNSNRKAYLQKAMKTAVAVWNSSNESSPICPVECAYVGCIPIMPKRPWFESMAPGWPLSFSTMAEAHQLVLHALDNQEKYSLLAHEYAKKNYNVLDLGRAFVNHLDGEAYKENLIHSMDDVKFARFCSGSKLVDDLMKVCSGKSEVLWSELSKVSLPRNRMGDLTVLSHHDLPALVARLTGLKDDVSEAVPVFRK